jgi:hypothetical protein
MTVICQAFRMERHPTGDLTVDSVEGIAAKSSALASGGAAGAGRRGVQGDVDRCDRGLPAFSKVARTARPMTPGRSLPAGRIPVAMVSWSRGASRAVVKHTGKQKATPLR